MYSPPGPLPDKPGRGRAFALSDLFNSIILTYTVIASSATHLRHLLRPESSGLRRSKKASACESGNEAISPLYHPTPRTSHRTPHASQVLSPPALLSYMYSPPAPFLKPIYSPPQPPSLLCNEGGVFVLFGLFSLIILSYLFRHCESRSTPSPKQSHHLTTPSPMPPASYRTPHAACLSGTLPPALPTSSGQALSTS